jgi:hypothetical protein
MAVTGMATVLMVVLTVVALFVPLYSRRTTVTMALVAAVLAVLGWLLWRDWRRTGLSVSESLSWRP